MRMSSLTLYDRATNGRLVPRLNDLRLNGASYDVIVDALRDELDVRVSRTTVARWLTHIDSTRERAS